MTFTDTSKGRVARHLSYSDHKSLFVTSELKGEKFFLLLFRNIVVNISFVLMPLPTVLMLHAPTQSKKSTFIGEPDTYRGNTIENRGCLFIYLFIYMFWTYVCHFVL